MQSAIKIKNNDYFFNMKLFFFPEFKNTQLIKQFQIRFPNIELPTYSLTEKTSGEFCEIMNTSVKLFYENEDGIDELVNSMIEIGFQLIERNPSHILSFKVADKTIHTKKYYGDRVIFSG